MLQINFFLNNTLKIEYYELFLAKVEDDVQFNEYINLLLKLSAYQFNKNYNNKFPCRKDDTWHEQINIFVSSFASGKSLRLLGL